MNKEIILRKLNDESVLDVTPRDADVQIQGYRDEVKITLIVPYNVTEIYFEAKDRTSGKIIEDSMDYYGNTKKNDFEEDLNRFLDVMRDCPLRMDTSKNLVEYFKDDWQYFFGKVPDEMLR